MKCNHTTCIQYILFNENVCSSAQLPSESNNNKWWWCWKHNYCRQAQKWVENKSHPLEIVNSLYIKCIADRLLLYAFLIIEQIIIVWRSDDGKRLFGIKNPFIVFAFSISICNHLYWWFVLQNQYYGFGDTIFGELSYRVYIK